MPTLEKYPHTGVTLSHPAAPAFFVLLVTIAEDKMGWQI